MQKNKFSKSFFLFALPVLLGLVVILKVFFIPDCYGFDFGEDANHAFVNLGVSRSILAQGQLPLINLFNNFGTPILGDAITYPFAIQSLTYYFLPDYVAMTVNRFLIACLTYFLLVVFFKRWMSDLASYLCAFGVFCFPEFLWHFAHHHYQMSLAFALALMFLVEKFSQNQSIKNCLALFLCLILLFLSVNIQVVLIVLAFVFSYQLFLLKEKGWRGAVCFAGFIFAAAAVVAPDLIQLGINVFLSVRARIPYEPIEKYLWNQKYTLLALISYWNNIEGAWNLGSVFLPLPILFLFILGFWRAIKINKNKSLAFMVLALGFFPRLAVLLLLLFPKVWHAVPLLGGVAIGRFCWIANVFLFLGVGLGVDVLVKGRVSRKVLKVCFFTSVLALVGMLWLFSKQIVLWYHVFTIGLLALVLFLKCFNRHALRIKSGYYLSIFMIALSVVLPFIPVVLGVMGLDDLTQCRVTHYYSDKTWAEFYPKPLLSKMQPFSRLASDAYSHYGHDLHCFENNVLGSNGRSVFLDQSFFDHLISEKLIAVDSYPIAYHFTRPWKVERLTDLGIRYLLQKDPFVDKGLNIHPDELNYALIGEGEGYFLFENLRYRGFVYMENDPGKPLFPLESVEIRGNRIHVQLPDLKAKSSLIASFLALPGWKARTSLGPKKIQRNKDQMIRIEVEPGEQDLVLFYEPFSVMAFFGFGIFGCLLFGLTAAYALPSKNLKN